jgi:putative ABC transport system permease protein
VILSRVLAALIRGPGSEFIRGDLEETRARGRGGWGSLVDVVSSLLAWYRPSAFRGRRRLLRKEGESDVSQRMKHGGGMGGGSLGADVRVALRSLLRRPGFAAIVVLTLGLGIGATTTIFSVVDAVVLRSLPYEGADRLVALGNTFPGREWSEEAAGLQHLAGVSYLNFVELRERTRSFEAVAAGERASVLLPDQGDGPQLASMVRVTEGFFQLLGVRPVLGRTFLPEEFGPGAGQLVILSHAAWVNRYGADPSVVGGQVTTAGDSYTIVGVLPQDFRPPEAMFSTGTEFWMPLDPTHPRYERRGGRSLSQVGRLRTGVSVEQARSELALLGPELAEEFPDGNTFADGSYFGWGANSLQAQTVGGTGRILLIFLSAAGLLLLIAVLNAAHLFLVRGLDRVGELSVRKALGASRWALARQLLVESSILALLGGGLGIALAYGGVEGFLRLGPARMPRTGEVAVDLRVLAITAVVSLGAGLITGLFPVLQQGGRDIAGMLRTGGDRTVAPPGSRRRMVMVSAQLALALVLTVGASLLFDSFLRVRNVDPGFEPEGLVAFSMPVKRPAALDQASWQGWDDLLREVRAIPGVSVGGGSNLPFQDPNWAPAILLPGEPPETRRSGIAGYAITPGYLETLGIPLKGGRAVHTSDGPDAEAVALVNETFVQEVLGGGNALGQELRFRGDEGTHRSVRVVGVVGDVVRTRVQDGMRPAVYLPYTQVDWPNVQVAVRTDGDPAALAPALRAAAKAFSPLVPVRNISTMVERIGVTRTDPRFQALLLGSFALVAVLLAAVGLYGNLAHMVGRRMRELGIRVALGADGSSILGLVFRQGLLATLLGLAGGVGGAFFATRFLRRFLFEIGTLHLPAFILAVVGLGGAALLAALLPALRATRVDPAKAFHSE